MARMTFDEYVKVKAINWSTLKEMRRSPKHYRYRADNPREDSSRLALGRACHTAVYEPDRFMLEYACYKGSIRRGKKWDAFKEQHQGETILKVDEYNTCMRVRDAVRGNAVAAEYLRQGEHELTITWTDAATKLACKGRLDYRSNSIGAIVDLKTTNDISPNRFGSTAARMGYHIQGAWYQAGYLASFGLLLPVVIIAVEIEPPYDVAVYELGTDELYAGEIEWMRLLADVKSCQDSGRWPGRFEEKQTLRLPSWALGTDGDDDFGGMDLVFSGQAG